MIGKGIPIAFQFHQPGQTGLDQPVDHAGAHFDPIADLIQRQTSFGLLQSFVEGALLGFSDEPLVSLEQVEADQEFEDPRGGPVARGCGRFDLDGQRIDPLQTVDHRPERFLEGPCGHPDRGPPAAAFQPLDQRPGRAAADSRPGAKGEEDFRHTPEGGRQHGLEGDA